MKAEQRDFLKVSGFPQRLQLTLTMYARLSGKKRGLTLVGCGRRDVTAARFKESPAGFGPNPEKVQLRHSEALLVVP